MGVGVRWWSARLLLFVCLAGRADEVAAAPFAYVSNLRGGSVSVVDTATNAVSATIPTDDSPYGVATDPSGTRVFVSDVGSNQVSVIDTTTNAVTATIAVGAYPAGLATTPSGDRLYVTSYLGDSVSVIDTSTQTVTATIPVSGGPYGVTVSPTPTVLLGGQGWEVVADSGLARSRFSVVVLGQLGGDLYLFGSQVESAGALAGVFRYRDGVLTSVGTVTGQDYNRFLDHGAVEFNGGLMIGDRHGGKLYRMDLDQNGLATVQQVAQVGGEDVFPGPLLWGRLWLGTFGRTGASPLNPGAYSYDGTIVTLTHEFVLTGSGGQVLSLVEFEGKLWASTREAAGDVGRVWSSDDGYTWTREYSGTPYYLTVWHNELLGCKAAVHVSTNLPQFSVWHDGWVDVGPRFGQGSNLGGIVPVGNEILAFDYYEGVYAYGGGLISSLPGLGVFAGDGGVVSVAIYDDYLWVTTSQPVRLYRRKLAHRVFVTSFLAGTLSIIDPITNTLNAVLPVGAGPLGLAVDAEGSTVWVANFDSGTVSKVDVATLTVAATIAVGTNPTGIAVAGGRVFVANYGDASVSVIDATSNTVLATVPVGGHPYGVGIGTDGAAAYVANQADDTVSVIDTATSAVVATVGVGRRPTAFGLFTGGPEPSPCSVPGPDGCDDGDICTVDSCTVDHGCRHEHIAGCCNGDVDCNDASVCTGAETCVDHACLAGTALACDDGNSCTDDLCDAVSGCQHTSRTGPCDDHNACTVGDTCSASICIGTPLVCADDDGCTTDACNPASGCTFTPVPECCHTTGDCGDDDACTVDACGSDGHCQHDTIPGCCNTDADCDDGEECTTDTCLGRLGCLHRPREDTATMCRLDALASTLVSAAASDLGGQSQKRRLERLITSARNLASRPHGTGLRTVRIRLLEFIRLVDRAIRRASIDATVGERLLALAEDASATLPARAPGRRR